jgi:flagellar motor switch protein FliM
MDEAQDGNLAVADPAAADSMSAGGVFHEIRLLTPERSEQFERTAGVLAERLEDELARWLGEASVMPAMMEQSVGFTGVDIEGCDLALLKSQFASGFGLITTDLPLALSMVSVLCGGTGGDVADIRPLSRLEVGVVDLILQPLVDLTVELFQLGSWELGPHVSGGGGLPPSTPGEAVVAMPFHISAAKSEGTLRVVLSSSQLQNYLDGIDRRLAGQSAVHTEPCVEIVRAVRPVPVELVAGFEPLRVPAKELVGLKVGDIVRTRQSVTRPLVARVGEERLFHFRPGQQGQRLVAEVTAVIGPGLGEGS